eukprot:175718-Amorphochlora_amoeboformis.AAC.2
MLRVPVHWTRWKRERAEVRLLEQRLNKVIGHVLSFVRGRRQDAVSPHLMSDILAKEQELAGPVEYPAGIRRERDAALGKAVGAKLARDCRWKPGPR